MNEKRLPENLCPHCNHKTTGAMDENGEAVIPPPGGISICIRCGELGTFGDDLKIKPFSILDVDDKETILTIRKNQFAIAHCQLTKDSH